MWIRGVVSVLTSLSLLTPCLGFVTFSGFQFLSQHGSPKSLRDMLPSLTSLPIGPLCAPYQPALFYYSFAFPQAAMLFLAFIIGLRCSHCLEHPPSSPPDACSLQSLFWSFLLQIRWIRHVPLSSFRPYACICHKVYHVLFVHMCIPLSFLYSLSLAKCLTFVGD